MVTTRWFPWLLLSYVLSDAQIFDSLVTGVAAASPPGGGNYQECVSILARSFPYCNQSLSHEERVEWLINNLTLTEKLGLLSPDPALKLDCYDLSNPIPRLGIGRYMWLVETNSQANSFCWNGKKCATAFPGALGLAATFNRSVWYAKGDVISTEMRALYNSGGRRRFPATKVGLTGFGPNINIARDPRFGRTSELPGEDPYLNGQYGIQFIRGKQQIDNNGYLKVMSFLKHYTAYSREENRGKDTYNINKRMMFDTYLPAFQAAFQQQANHAPPSGVMCSYTGINGHPSCANDWLIQTIMRQQWHQPDAIVMTDCGAVRKLGGKPAKAPSLVHAVAWTLGNGTDVEAGSHVFVEHGIEAIKRGLLQESMVDASVRRILRGMMKVGRFDYPYTEKVPSWSSITADAIGSPEHTKIRNDAARQSMVLLRNLGNALPLDPTNKQSKIVVVGPQANTGAGLLPDYWGDQVCVPAASPSSSQPTKPFDYCITTIYQAIRDIHGGDTLVFPGVDEINTENQTASYREAVQAVAQHADVVVLVLGISKQSEKETLDRNVTSLPGLQTQFGQDVLDIAKKRDIPAIVVLVNGGALSIDEFMPTRDYPANLPKCYQSRAGVDTERLPRQYAIVEAYNPSVGAKGIVESLFGIGPITWGRMVTTMYPKDWAKTHPPNQYDLAAGDGLTYRYHTSSVLATFGEGMPAEDPSQSPLLKCEMTQVGPPHWIIKCTATSSGNGQDRLVSSLAMLYVRTSPSIRKTTPYPVPLRSLRGFQRVMLGCSESKSFEFDLTLEDFKVVNEDGHREALPGRHFDRIDVWDGWDYFQSFPVNLPEENVASPY